MKIKLAVLFILLFSGVLCGQNYYNWYVEGKILNKETKEPIPYTNIYNKTTQKGTLSNVDGFFKINTKSLDDSIYITFIGYKKQLIILKEDINFYTIYLEESIQLLDEVTITPKDNSYLFDLLSECRKKSSVIKSEAKAYYELKSFRDDKQMELVEGFYNVGINGYDPTDLKLKAGRLALQPYNNRFFVSLESSRAITMLKLFDKNHYFPGSPLELSKKRAQKSFYLYLEKEYLDAQSDSIYVIGYKPIDAKGQLYEGKIWINPTKKYIIKITLNCRNSLLHPFSPLFPTDRITNVSFNITKSFTTLNSQMVFNHIDFTYVIDYKSRIGKSNELNYSIKTNAILYAYDFHAKFVIPKFGLKEITLGDYKTINAMPYNNFFWQYNDEYKLNDHKNSNKLFFNDVNSITNKIVFTSNSYFKKGLLEHPYIAWSENRIIFRGILADTLKSSSPGGIIADQYNLSAKLFMDINTYNDSTNIHTAAIFDPYESFYHLPMDNKTFCFVNIFFDLCEIERRKLDTQLKTVRTISRIQELYTEFLTDFEKQKYHYLKLVERGTNKAEMLKWNSYVYDQLGINNIAIFNPFPEKK